MATATSEKPSVLPVDPDGIPQELKDTPQWIVWKLCYRNGRWTKVPFNPATGGEASSTDPKTWTSFNEAYGEYTLAGDRWDGIGFVFSKDDPYVGIDLDDCRDPDTGKIQPWTAEQRAKFAGSVPDPVRIIASLGTFAEVSPSGTGYKVFGRGEAHGKRCRKGSFEHYDKGRYFTITGHKLPGSPATLNDCNGSLSDLYDSVFGKEKEQKKVTRGDSAGMPGPTDGQVLTIAGNADNGQKFRRLMGGDTDGYDSPSEADAGLACILAFWTRDTQQMERLMRQSKLGREKWSREDYLPRTITSAIEIVTESYTWPDDRRQPTRGSRPLTDSGNAERFADQHGDKVRYCYPWNGYLAYDGARWARDCVGAVEQLAKQTARSILKEASGESDDDRRKALVKYATRSESGQSRASMLRLAQSEPGIPIMPEQLDQDVWALNCPNGTIDLRTGNLRPHRREDHITKLCHVVYDSDATCPRWIEFQDRICDGHESLIAFKQRFYGYCLTGDVSEQVLLILYGGGANGKSTEVNTFLRLLGEDYAMKAPADFLMVKRGEHPTAQAGLYGMRFVACVETDEGRRFAESMVKDLTGSERIRARRMREDFWEFDPTHKIILASNHKPTVRGTDHAIWRRIRLVPFAVTIPESEQDKSLPGKLLTELPGILAWCVRGCLD